jgi:hypothetical protein
MNSIIALPIASAIPTSAPAMFSTGIERDLTLGAAEEISRHPDAELIAAGREFASLLVRPTRLDLLTVPALRNCTAPRTLLRQPTLRDGFRMKLWRP